MKNLKYWKSSLANVLVSEDITDKLVNDIINISEMEYEYTEHEAHKGEIENPLQNKLNQLQKEIEIYKNHICRTQKVDSVGIEYNGVRYYNKLP